MTKFIKGFGVGVIIVSLIVALGFVGRIESEDYEYRAGEITKAEMTPDDKLWRDVGALIASVGSGCLIYVAGCGMELLKEKREARERWFDDDEEIY